MLPQHRRRRERAAPQRTSALDELGLAVLTRLLAAPRDTQRNAAVLDTVATMLAGVPPAQLFADVARPRAPPEVLVAVTEAQVSADSSRSSSSHAPFVPFAAAALAAAAFLDPTTAPPPKGGKPGYWCSRAQPIGGKTTLTVTLGAPQRLTALVLELPEAKARPAWVGVETLPARRERMGASDIAVAVLGADAIAGGGGGGGWVHAGVVPADALTTSSGASRLLRVPLPPLAHASVALRISFKGFAHGNRDHYHGLAKCGLLAEADGPLLPQPALLATRGGAGGATGTAATRLFTESHELLASLEEWALAAGTGGASGGEGARQLSASVRCLAALAQATGALSSVLALVQVRSDAERGAG